MAVHKDFRQSILNILKKKFVIKVDNPIFSLILLIVKIR